MNNRTKNVIYTIIVLLAVLIVWLLRKNSAENYPKEIISGQTMGTTYRIIYFGKEKEKLKSSIDSLLIEFNNSLNTYLKDSEISKFNNGNEFSFKSPFFLPVLRESKKIFELSGGAFDPTVGPLVNLWGFGPDDGENPDSSRVDSVKQLTGFDKIIFNDLELQKTISGVKLDFSAIAKGYGVDIVSDFLRKKGFKNHFVEIGGEVRCMGVNREKGKAWVVGITDPASTLENTRLFATLDLSDRSMATSGNYYNYRVIDGIKYSHTIDPGTGFPVDRKLLSASVILHSCMAADGLATAFMVMGHEKAMDVLNKNDSIQAYLIYSDDDGNIIDFATPGIRDALNKIKK